MTVETRLDAIEAILAKAAEAPSGAEYSYPVANMAMSESQWQQVALGMGSGILDRGGAPYNLKHIDNAADTVTLTVSTTTGDAQALVHGFYHRMTEDKVLSVPAVTTTTTYRIVIEYTPLEVERTSGGPCRVRVIAGDLPSSQGRKHIELWRVTRRANQLLTDAEVVQVRPKVAPQITVDTKANLPSPQSVLWGTTCVITHGDAAGTIYQADGSDPGGAPQVWENITSPQWRTLALSSAFEAQGNGAPQYRFHQGRVEFRGAFRRKDGGDFARGQATVIGWVSGVRLGYEYVAAATSVGAGQVRTALGSSGYVDNLSYLVNDAGVKWMSLHNVSFDLPGVA